MHVLICVSRLDKGGAEILECRLAVELNKIGIVAHIACQYGPEMSDQIKGYNYWLSQGVPKIHWLLMMNKKKSMMAILRMGKIIKKQQIDVVITTSIGTQIIGSIVTQFMNCKHIVAFHTYYTANSVSSYRIKLWKYLIRKADQGYFISYYVRNATISMCKFPVKKSKVIYNSIDYSKAPKEIVGHKIRQELKIPGKSKILLIVGRVVYIKGLDILLETISQMLEKWDAYIVIVGNNYNKKQYSNVNANQLKINNAGLTIEDIDYNIKIAKMIKKLGIKHRVKFCGYSNNIPNYMSSADLLIHMPRVEGFGLVLIEAIAHGLPIIASNVGGIPEVLKNTPYLTLDLQSKSEIVLEISKLLNYPENKKTEYANAAKESLKKFTHKRRTKKIAELCYSTASSINKHV